MRFNLKFRISAIVAALALCAGAALTGCGNRGGLYLPTVPPMPQKPVFDDTVPSSHAASDADTSNAADTSDASDASFALTPDTALGASQPAARRPNSGAAAPAGQ